MASTGDQMRLDGKKSRLGRVVLSLQLLVLQLLLAAVACAEQPRPLMLIGPPWPPYLDPRNPGQGLATEIVLASLAAGGFPHSQIHLRPWRRVLLEAGQGQVDGLIGLWHSEERESKFLFSEPYLASPIVLVLPKETELIPGSFQELEGLRLAYRKGASFGATFDDSDRLDKYPVGGTLSMARMVARGRMDAGLEDGLVLEQLMQHHPDLKALLHLVKPPLLKQPLHFAAPVERPGAGQLVEAFNRGLKRIRADGRYKALLEGYASVWNGDLSAAKLAEGESSVRRESEE